MNESSQFKLLPFILLRSGHNICCQFHFLVRSEKVGESEFFFKIGIGPLAAACGKQQQEQEYKHEIISHMGRDSFYKAQSYDI
jgi:hypothetical protein